MTSIQQTDDQAVVHKIATLPKRKFKIMIVDDNEDLLEELQRMLTMSGYDVGVISDSKLAFEELLRSEPDLVLLDLKMEPKSGFEVAHEVRYAWLMKDIPIIAMTGFFTKKEHILMTKLCGIKDVILKPFNPLDLIGKVEFALGHRTSEEYDDEST